MKESQSALSTFHFMADVLLEPLRWYVSFNNLVNDLRKSKWELQLCSYSVNGQVYIYNWMFLYSEVQELLVGFEAWSIQMVQLLATCRVWLLFVMRSVCVEKKYVKRICSLIIIIIIFKRCCNRNYSKGVFTVSQII